MKLDPTPGVHVAPPSSVNSHVAPPMTPDTLTAGLLVTQSFAAAPVSAARANVGIGSGTTGPTTVDHSLSPTAFTPRTRNQYCVPLTSGAAVSETFGGSTFVVVAPVNDGSPAH